MLYVLYFGNRVLKRISMVIMAIFLSNFSDHTAKRPIAHVSERDKRPVLASFESTEKNSSKIHVINILSASSAKIDQLVTLLLHYVTT